VFVLGKSLLAKSTRHKSGRTALRLFLLAILLTCPPSLLFKHSEAADAIQNTRRSPTEVYGPPTLLGHLKAREINESSGLVASRTRGIYWTHNDSGDGPFIYAIDDKGALRGVWRVAGAGARDWEDIAAGPGPDRQQRYLYVGDIGDNDSKRSEIVVYRFPEPLPVTNPSKSNAPLTERAEAIRLRYPDGSHDAETLLVHPFTGDIYIITKILLGKAVVYKASPPFSAATTVLVHKAELNVPSLLGGLVTGGDISPDGRRVALCDYLSGYELLLPEGDSTFDDVWNQPFTKIDLGKQRQREGIAYRQDGRALLCTSEGVGAPLIQVVRR